MTKRFKKVHNKNVPHKTLSQPYKVCMCCGNKMKRISGDERHLTNTEGRQKLFLEIYSCQNEKCEMYKKRIKPNEFHVLTFPKYSYGIDVFAEMGFLRLRENKTMKEVREIIVHKYPHIEVSVRHVENLVKVFMLTLETSKQDVSFFKSKLKP
jgi:hypothetical protein